MRSLALILPLVAACDPATDAPAEEAPPSATSAPTTASSTAPVVDTGSATLSPEVEACIAEPMAFVVGEGLQEHATLAHGDPVTLVHGGQGGWHLDLTGRVAGSSDLVSAGGLVQLVDDGRIIGGLEQQPVRTALVGWSPDDCAGDLFGLRMFVDDNGPHDIDSMCLLEGAAAELHIEVQDLLDPDPGNVVATTLEVSLALDPTDWAYCHGR